MAVAVAPGRLIHTVIPRRRGIVRLDSAEETLLEPIPPKLAEGANVLVEILRESIAEEGSDKLAKVRVAQAGAKALPAASLYQRIAALTRDEQGMTVSVRGETGGGRTIK